MMTAVTHEESPSSPKRIHRLGMDDPLLQDLWALKARLNETVDFNIARLAEEARRFDLVAELERLRNQRQN